MTKTIKIAIAGEGGVGKTSFLNRVLNGIFNENSELTKGVGFFNKEVQMSMHGEVYDLIFWDFGGQDRFRELLSDFANGSSVAMFLFDTTRFNTLDKIEEWMEILTEKNSMPILILGTKADSIDAPTREYFHDMLGKIVDAYDEIFDFELISSKNGENVESALQKIVDKLDEK